MHSVSVLQNSTFDQQATPRPAERRDASAVFAESFMRCAWARGTEDEE